LRVCHPLAVFFEKNIKLPWLHIKRQHGRKEAVAVQGVGFGVLIFGWGGVLSRLATHPKTPHTKPFFPRQNGGCECLHFGFGSGRRNSLPLLFFLPFLVGLYSARDFRCISVNGCYGNPFGKGTWFYSV